MNFNSFGNIEKGIYKDNYYNRKIGRVGQQYGNDFKDFIQNDDNVLNLELRYKDKKVGKIESFKEKDDKIIYFNSIIIDKEYRSKGLGKLLLTKYLNEAKKQKDFNKIILEVDSEDNHIKNISNKEKLDNNKKLINFYESLGFKIKTKGNLYTMMEFKIIK